MLSILSQLQQAFDAQQSRSPTGDSSDTANDDAGFRKDGSLANNSGLNLFERMDEEELVIDSPEQEPVEDEDLEDVDDALKLGQPAAAPKPAKDKDANREQVSYSLQREHDVIRVPHPPLPQIDIPDLHLLFCSS